MGILRLVLIALVAFGLLAAVNYALDQRKASRTQAADEARWQALIDSCHSHVIRMARYPSKVEFTKTRHGTTGGGRSVLGIVDLYNALGVHIPHQYHCQFDEHGELIGEPYLVEEGA
ncbi:hypothetical protein Tgr7_0403 [Thioalkalivibrio sulfidiphilus HL-EbGr7]|uniref:Uncharacterized protein n=2 Tax=Thioalkalivibrio TaxID=106633 RepID=B8GUZ0_THISH|nr:hypothetical protein Tgr7_0403 [Thioalkalivibrio sulfidiphilus HL-EbGr7]